MLYIVATPIGNRNDLSLRIAETLARSDIILCEDTRTFGTLKQLIREAYPMEWHSSQQVWSYYRQNEFQKLPDILDRLAEGADVSLVSDAGVPLISDPGGLLVAHVTKRGLPVTIVPGPSAVTSIVALSGFTSSSFYFSGFLPKKPSQKRKILSQWKHLREIDSQVSIVWMDSPMRLPESLQMIDEEFPRAPVAVGRELTKQYEEVIRGTAGELVNHSWKGEVIAVMGADRL